DFQQLKVIEKMARELQMGIEIVGCQIVREPDGLAMSSRNANLSPEEREAARVIHRSLKAGSSLVENGGKDASAVIREMHGEFDEEPGVDPHYIAVVDAETLEPLEILGEGPARALVAARVGDVRLIDNISLPSAR
ncbi:MAG: pantoate--beta-alanine ligase, partial [Actinomycetota bacterium]|nr:pantoate--beta-alanine ligase [Actinomycetota bacterium]